MSLVDRAVRQGMRLGWRRGLGDGSRVWLAVGAVAVTVRLLQRMAAPGKATILTEVLEPGETIVIHHLVSGE